MELNSLIEKVLTTKELTEKPPVLLDIGASGEIHPEWRLIAKHSVCVAFDADSRDFNSSETNSGYKKIHLINAIVSNKTSKTTEFYLTSSPHCSSSLYPINSKLESWSFSDLFKVEKTIELNNVSLAEVLKEKNINYIDWFKTDSQGTDLRLFNSLSDDLQKNAIIAQFEPGIIDAYKGEDKFHSVLAYMDTMPYWASEINIMGSKRISKNTLEKYKLKADTAFNIPNSSCWGEITYFNSFDHKNSDRDILLAWVFATVKQQHGFALDVLNLKNTINKTLIDELIAYSLNVIKPIHIEISTKQKIKNKLISFINKL
jgi:FkbM family methyltransferase